MFNYLFRLQSILTIVCFMFLAKNSNAATPEQTTFTFKVPSCVGTKSATAWVGNRVVIMIEGESPSSRSATTMNKVLDILDAMDAKFVEFSGLSNLPKQSSYKGLPVIEIVTDNCGYGGLAYHGTRGMSTGKVLFNEVYDAANSGRNAIHQVFLYETARNFYLTRFNNKFDWIMNDNASNWGWWTVGFNNAQAVMIPTSLNYELLYYGQSLAQFREGMVSKFEYYLNNTQYNFDNTWRKDRLPWRQQSSVNDLMTGMIIYSYENFGGDAWIKKVYRYLESNVVSDRSSRTSYQECRDNVYKIWSLSANRNLEDFFERDMRWVISSSAKSWVINRLGNNGGDNGGEEITGIAPKEGSVLKSNSVEFKWDLEGDSHWLYVGTSVGETDILNTGGEFTEKKYIVNNLPNTGTVYLRLWSKINNNWSYNDYTYTMSVDGNGGDNGSDNGEGTCDWVLQDGNALDIGAYENDTYVVGTDNYLYKSNGYNGFSLVDNSMRIKKVDVGQSGLWAINTDNRIYQYTNNTWVYRRGIGTDIAVGNNVYTIGTDGKVYKYLGDGWSSPYGTTLGTDIAAASDDRPWIRGTDGYVYQWLGSRWDKKGNLKIKDIAINPTKDEFVFVDTNNSVQKYVGSGTYEVLSGIGSRISITSDSKLWTVTSTNKIYHYTCDFATMSSSARSINSFENEVLNDDFNQVIFYPNPISNQKLNIKGLPLDKEVTISISNIQGQVIYNLSTTTKEIITLSLKESRVPHGIYILKIEMIDDVITTKIKVN
ncbi:T9SS type A sorting domain-containing protein [Flammeovirga yaeyamensis]|uniref:T9SS type A sorting domain-containing protein n=1 Tax=Flammeovirga yaeyamensis TaxID=367791 RepID=A0AAX1N9M1_9BACT|nr:T9SS type A sorting domain-containing protein [Flammeovirga yaeyamensis]MBB3699453.1 hypothetical protein [Flammeovirga yaeyamensis]NMF35290.1 T9SS type A sorting domain-containing protein [Flammeovirga yaeyamensis]QWG04150.1 T9SS type A sorting domain-containing protein [Flammeovirga yaeyamensis]